MSSIIETVSVYAPVVFVLAPLAAFAVVIWQRAFGGEESLAFGEMLFRQGVKPNRPWTEHSARELAAAARRCASCGATRTCREWLDSGRREGYEEFCVNAPFIDRLKT